MALRLIGAKKLASNFRAIRSGIVSPILARALFEEAERVLTRSRPLVPVDTGNLRSTGKVLPPERSRSRMMVTFGYGGRAGRGEIVNYAIPVHERLDVRHTVGQAKYLEQPFLELRPSIERRLGGAVTAELKLRAKASQRL